MPDFLSRLMKRTFSLVPVAQPVTHSIFAPEHSVRSNYIQNYSSSTESVGNQNIVNIDGSYRTSVVPQNDYQPLLNLKKQSSENDTKLTTQTEDRDSRIRYTSTSRPLRNIEPLIVPPGQNDPGTQEQIEPIPLQQTSKQDDRHLHALPAERAQSNDPLNTIDSATLESVEFKLLPVKNRNDRSTLQPTQKSILYEEQSRTGKQDSLERLEPFIDSGNSLSGKKLTDHISDSSLSSGSLSNLRKGEPLVQNSKPASNSDFWPTSRADSYSPGYMLLDARSSPIIPSKQNLKRVIIPKVNATLEQTGNVLIEKHAAVPQPSTTVPTIKVTIGRIEVKAVKPPQEPQPQTPPPRERPVLSLDDYLKQNSG